MKKQTPAEQNIKIQKQNIIVFKKRNSGKLKPNFREIDKQQDAEQKSNPNNKPKSQLPSEESVKLPRNQLKIQRKGLPLLSLAGNNTGKKIIIQKALLEYSKNLPPTSLYHDKEALLQESLQLKRINIPYKEKNNELISQNIKLKTRLTAVQKQNLRLQKFNQQDGQVKRSMTKQLKIKSGDQVMNSLKSLLKQTKKQNEQIKQQNNRIKKSVKYTRINELQQQKKKGYHEQTLRLRELLEQQFNQNINNKLNQHDITSLQQKISTQNQLNSHLKRQNSQLNNKLKSLEQKLKIYGKSAQLQKNLNRIIISLKKSLKQKQIEIQNLKKIQKQQTVISRQEKPKTTSAKKMRVNDKQKIDGKTLQIKCQNCPKIKTQIQNLNQKIRSLQQQLKSKNQIIQNYTKNTHNLNKTIVKKPSIQFLKHISEFLIYRFKAHHLTMQSIQTYLFKKDTIKTTVSQMIEILLAEPFFITNSDYLQALVIHLYYNNKSQAQFEIDQKFQRQNNEIFKIFKQLIGDYQIMDQKKQQEMFIQIAQLITNYCKHISAAFDAKRNGEGTIDRIQLYAFLNQIQLEKEYIQFIVTQIILQSFDLEHLNYYALFQIFYLPVQQETKGFMNQKTGNRLQIQNEIKQQDQQYEQSHSHFEKSKADEKEQKLVKKSNFNSKQLQNKDNIEQVNNIDEEGYEQDFNDQQQKEENNKQNEQIQGQKGQEQYNKQEKQQQYNEDYENYDA